jgi:hypothetical protein
MGTLVRPGMSTMDRPGSSGDTTRSVMGTGDTMVPRFCVCRIVSASISLRIASAGNQAGGWG